MTLYELDEVIIQYQMKKDTEQVKFFKDVRDKLKDLLLKKINKELRGL